MHEHDEDERSGGCTFFALTAGTSWHEVRTTTSKDEYSSKKLTPAIVGASPPGRPTAVFTEKKKKKKMITATNRLVPSVVKSQQAGY